MDVLIRPVRPDEIIETARIYVDAYPDEYAAIVSEHYISAMNVDAEAEESLEWTFGSDCAGHIHHVAVIDGRVVGFVAASIGGDDEPGYDCEVHNLFVRKEYQGHGIGLRLLERAASDLQLAGGTKLIIYGYTKARSAGFYRSLDGQAVKQLTQYPGGQPAEVTVFGWDLPELLRILGHKLNKR